LTAYGVFGALAQLVDGFGLQASGVELGSAGVAVGLGDGGLTG